MDRHLETPLLHRHLETLLPEALGSARAINLIGPRQVGKTTLVRDLFKAGRFVTLDDTSTLAAIETDPYGQIETLAAEAGDGTLVIDEAQRSKALPLAIKRVLDRRRARGQFILTGSSNVFRTADVADSLAGRLLTVKLWPLTQAEIDRKPVTHLPDWALSASPALEDLPSIPRLTRRDYIDRLLAGGYPEARTLPARARRVLYRDIVDSVVDRDVADLLEIRKTERLRRLIDQVAARTATTLNITDLAGTVGLSRATVDAYLDVLIRLSLILPLGAWAPGESKKEVRQPKIHLVDSGIAGALRRLVPESFDADAQPATLGGMLESFIVNEILRALPFQNEDIAAYHWRSRDGQEIDLILEGATGLAGIEIKASSGVDESDFRHLDRFAHSGPGKGRRMTKIVFYLGERSLSFGPRRVALPVGCLWAG